MTTCSSAQLPRDVVERIVRHSDGIPLYIEEIGRMVADAVDAGTEVAPGPRPLAGSRGVAIPTTLQASLMARLDRLGVGKRVAQWGSVIGREFDYRMLEVVADMEPDGAAGRARPAARERTALRQWHASERHVYVQARVDPGRRLRLAPEAHAGRAARAHRAGDGAR